MCHPRPKKLFQDIQEFHKVKAFDVFTCLCSSIPMTEVIFLGFSCKSISHDNVHSSSAKNCVTAGSRQTGETWQGGLNYIRRAKPTLVFLENVQAITEQNKDGTSNAMEVERLLALEGYCTVQMVLDSRLRGSPQRRTRWWACAMRVQDSALTLQDIESYRSLKESFVQAVDRMQMESAALDELLLAEDGVGFSHPWLDLLYLSFLSSGSALQVGEPGSSLQLEPASLSEHDLVLGSRGGGGPGGLCSFVRVCSLLQLPHIGYDIGLPLSRERLVQPIRTATTCCCGSGRPRARARTTSLVLASLRRRSSWTRQRSHRQARAVRSRQIGRSSTPIAFTRVDSGIHL